MNTATQMHATPTCSMVTSSLTRRLLAVALGMASVGGAQSAATVPATAPSTVPTSGPARPRLEVPPGFVRIDVGTRHLLIEPADEAWVREAVAEAGKLPVTRPSTLPADLLAAVTSRFDEVVARIAEDLAADKGAVGKSVEQALKRTLEDFESRPVESVGMVTTRERLRELGRRGWENPSFRYNRVADEVYFSDAFVLSSDVDAADSLVPMVYDATLAADARLRSIVEGFRRLDAVVLRAKSQRGQFLLQAALLRVLGEHTLPGSELKPDQEWLRVGVVGVLTAKYTSMLSGVPRRAVVEAMTADPRRGGLRARTIDLLGPMDPAVMRREAVMPYADALRRKSVKVADDLVLRHGDEVLPRILRAVAEKKPADGKALVEVVREVTGTDITPWLRPG